MRPRNPVLTRAGLPGLLGKTTPNRMKCLPPRKHSLLTYGPGPRPAARPGLPAHSVTYTWRKWLQLKALPSVVAAGCAVAVLSSAGAERDSPVTLDSYGFWSLERLGYSDLDVPVSQTGAVSAHYVLPPDARQGPDDWYLIRLHVALEFSETSPPGRVYIEAATNGAAAAMLTVSFEVEAGQPKLTWDGVSLGEGSRHEQVDSRRSEIRYSNYVQYSGVKGGDNVLTFGLEQLTGARLKNLLVLAADSGVEFTHKSPPKLEIKVEPTAKRVDVGDELNLNLEIRNHGDWSLSEVVAETRPDDSALQVDGQSVQRLSLVDGVAVGSFALTARQSGIHRVSVRASGGGAASATTFDVQVGGDGQSSSLLRLDFLAGLALLGGGSLLTTSIVVTWAFGNLRRIRSRR